MPSTKSSKSPKRSGSSKSKRSPSNKGSQSKKGSPKKSPKKQGSPKRKVDASEEIIPFFRPLPPPPSPPPPPKGPLVSRLRRQVWYPEANRAAFEYKEWFWSPYCPVITSWGDIWVSDPPQRRILRYYFDPVSAKISLRSPNIITRGEPRMMKEIPRTGCMAVLLSCPTAKKTSLSLFDPRTFEVTASLTFPYSAEEAPKPDLPVSKSEPAPIVVPAEDDSTPVGLCANSDILFILTHPIQKMKLYEPKFLKQIQFSLENAYPDESTCVHLASSGGCEASEEKLFVSATRPPRVQVFWINRQRLLSSIDRVELTWYAELGLDRLLYGEPFGIQIDSLGMMVVSDSKAGFMRVYNVEDKRPPGPWLPSLPSGETSYFGSWKIDPYQDVRPGHFSLGKNGTACIVDRWSNKMYIVVDQTVLRWYDETLLVLDEQPYLRPIIDPLMPADGLPPPPVVEVLNVSDFRRTVSDKSEPLDEEVILPESLAARYRKKEDIEEEKASRKSSPKKGKSPKQKSPKSGSPKSKSPKSGFSKTKSPKSGSSKRKKS